MTTGRTIQLRPGTIERVPSPSEIRMRWFADQGCEVLRDLQDQIDRLRGTVEPTKAREALRRLDVRLRGSG